MQLMNQNVARMTSYELAKLTGKRHDNVKRTITNLVNDGIIKLPQIEEIPTNTLSMSAFVFSGESGKRDCLVIAARLSPAFMAKIVDRWQELERMVSAPALPQSFADALRLAADQQELIEQQKGLIALQAPAVEFVDNYVNADGLMGFRQVAKLLEANERKFKQLLLDRGVMYYLGGVLTPKAEHIQAGRFEMKTGTNEQNDRAFTQSKFTPKGVEWISKIWRESA